MNATSDLSRAEREFAEAGWVGVTDPELADHLGMTVEDATKVRRLLRADGRVVMSGESRPDWPTPRPTVWVHEGLPWAR